MPQACDHWKSNRMSKKQEESPDPQIYSNDEKSPSIDYNEKLQTDSLWTHEELRDKIIKKFTLNEEQSKAFQLIVNHTTQLYRR